MTGRRRGAHVATQVCAGLVLLVLLPVARAAPPPAATSTTAPQRLAGMSDARAPGPGANPPWLQQALHGLVARGDADSLLAAALMTYEPAQRAQYAQAASLVAPKDPGLAWLHWQWCDIAAHCDAKAALAWWQALEPGNAAAWLPRVAAAARDGDPRALDAALGKMAGAPHFNLHVFALAQRALRVRAVAALPPTLSARHHDDYLVDFFEQGIQAMQQGPFAQDLAVLGRACVDGNASANRAADCTRIGTAMEHSGALLAMLAGTTLAMHAGGDAGVRAAAARRLRALVWRVSHLPALARAAYDDSALARAWLAAVRTQTGELAALDALLRYRHIALQPPPGWQLPRPGSGAPSGGH